MSFTAIITIMIAVIFKFFQFCFSQFLFIDHTGYITY